MFRKGFGRSEPSSKTSSPVAAPRRLGPRARLAAGLLWWPLLLLALATPVAGAFRQHQEAALESRGWVAAGLRIDVSDPPYPYPFDPAVRASGLDPYAKIVAVDGRPVSTAREAREAAARAATSGRLIFTVEAEDGRRRTHVLPASPGAGARAFQQAAGISFEAWTWTTFGLLELTSLGWILVAVLLWRARSREAAPAALSLALLAFVAASMFSELRILLGEPWAAGEAVLGAATIVLIAWALAAFPDGRLRTRPRRLFAAAAGVAAAPLLFLDPEDLTAQLYGATLMVVVFLGAAVFVAVQARRSSQGPERQQMKWVAGGLATGVCLLILALLLVPFTAVDSLGFGAQAWASVAISVLGGAGMVALVGGVAVALLRYRLYDAEALIGRSAGYALLTLTLVAAWASAESVLQGTLAQVVGEAASPLYPALAALLSALLIGPARKRLLGWTEARFRPAVARVAETLPERVGDLRETADPDEIARYALDALTAALRTEDGRLDLADAAALAQVGAAAPPGGWGLEVALETEDGGRPVGCLRLGLRPDGTPPNRDEREAVAAVARPLARALQSALHRRGRDAAIERRLAALHREVVALRRELPSPRV